MFLIVSEFWYWLWQSISCFGFICWWYLIDSFQDCSALHFYLIVDMIAHFWYVGGHYLRLLYSSFGASDVVLQNYIRLCNV